MKIRPIRNQEEYEFISGYISSLKGVKLSRREAEKVEVMQILLDNHDQKNSESDTDYIDEPQSLDQTFDLIKEVSKIEHRDLTARCVKLQEEVGELAAEVLKINGLKKTDKSKQELLKNILLEGTDCLIMAMDIISFCGFSKEEVSEMAEGQLKKWVNSITK